MAVFRSLHTHFIELQPSNPPLGMQPPHDLQHLSLDVGLADFATAQAFLEEVATGVLGPAGFRIRDILTQTARERAVLIAGGAVARDYFDLLIASADTAWENAQRRNAAAFTIGTEDLQAAPGLRLERKQSDLRNDAGRDATRLETRFEDLVSFVRDRETFFFLVRREHMDTGWGQEIVELEDLRFVHRIMTTRPNTASWRGHNRLHGRLRRPKTDGRLEEPKPLGQRPIGRLSIGPRIWSGRSVLAWGNGPGAIPIPRPRPSQPEAAIVLCVDELGRDEAR